MLRCNLSVLLAQRNLKITKVSTDTGISRTTLTALASNRGQGIQFDTLDTLCTYLKVDISQLLAFFPMDVEFSLTMDKEEPGENLYTLVLDVTENGKKREFDLYVTVYYRATCPESSDDDDMEECDPTLIDADIDIEFFKNDPEQSECLNCFARIPAEFLFDLQHKIVNELLSDLPTPSTNSDITCLWPFN